ncbi:hypothetical protein ACQ4LE_002225 [Meloidogyne hapla]|uniref:Peptidase A2 domain-containing protein n=1 Tax=Meloidogyne hapla TaxID=6305 RepID=A0A1I8B7K0_MELHA
MIVDTAAQITIISKDSWQEIGKPKLQEISYTGSGLGNSKFNIEGKFIAKIDCKNKNEELDCHVVDGKFNLIELPWLKKFKILKNIRIQLPIRNTSHSMEHGKCSVDGGHILWNGGIVQLTREVFRGMGKCFIERGNFSVEE